MKYTASESNIIDIRDSDSDGSQEETTGNEVNLGKNCDKKFDENFLMEPGRNCEENFFPDRNFCLEELFFLGTLSFSPIFSENKFEDLHHSKHVTKILSLHFALLAPREGNTNLMHCAWFGA